MRSKSRSQKLHSRGHFWTPYTCIPQGMLHSFIALHGAPFDFPILSGALRCSAWIERTPHPAPAALQHIRVDHGRSDVLVPQEFLHRPNVVAIL